MLKNINKNFEINCIFFLIIFAVLSRLIPHPPNFTPIGGIAIFAANKISDKRIAVFLPLICLFFSDLILGFSMITIFVYLAFVLISLSSIFFSIKIYKKVILSSILFFVVSNFGVWVLGYPKTVNGFIECYTLAIPFFLNTLIGDLFYTYVLLYGLKYLSKYFSPSVS